MFLLDTNVISEVRKTRPHGALLKWLGGVQPGSISMSAMTVGELQAGVAKTRRNDSAKADALERWIDAICRTHSILPLDAAVTGEWAVLIDRKSRTLVEDALIAATARVHGLTVATRNVKDFGIFDVPVLNPFE